MYCMLLEMVEKEYFDIVICNGIYVYEKCCESYLIFLLDCLFLMGVLLGYVWFKQVLDLWKFLYVIWFNIYCYDFICQYYFYFESGLCYQDILWIIEVLLVVECVQYISQQFYDYYIYFELVLYKLDNDDMLMCLVCYYMKILEMLEVINQCYLDKVCYIVVCCWQIVKEGLGIIYIFDSMKDEFKKYVIINEFFDCGIWWLIWKNVCIFCLCWCLGCCYLCIKCYCYVGQIKNLLFLLKRQFYVG